MKRLRIGLDIDDVLASFWSSYCKYFDTERHPEMLQTHTITRNVQRVLSKDRNFWLSLPVINTLDFEPELYCTKRVNNKAWTKQWLKLNGFPDRPVYQMYHQSGNKARLIKGRVDVFIDDSYYNVDLCNRSGVPALLYHTQQNADNPMYKVYQLSEKAICEAYDFLMKTW